MKLICKDWKETNLGVDVLRKIYCGLKLKVVGIQFVTLKRSEKALKMIRTKILKLKFESKVSKLLTLKKKLTQGNVKAFKSKVVKLF